MKENRAEGPRAVVIGSGIGGSVATLLLAHAGIPVTLIEKNRRLGGSCSGYEKQGFRIDIGTHMFCRGAKGPLGDVLRRVQSEGAILFVRTHDIAELRFIDSRDPRRVRGVAVPADVARMPRFAFEIVRALDLSLADALRAARLFTYILSMSDAEVASWDHRTIEEFLEPFTDRKRGAPPRPRRRQALRLGDPRLKHRARNVAAPRRFVEQGACTNRPREHAPGELGVAILVVGDRQQGGLLHAAALRRAAPHVDGGAGVSPPFSFEHAASDAEYFLMPADIGYALVLNLRMATFVGLFAVALARRSRGLRAALAAWLVAIRAVGSSVHCAYQMQAFQREEAASTDVVLRALPRGQRMLTLSFDPHSERT